MQRNITIVNFKGGVGKSMIAHQLITGYEFYGIEIDPYGSLAERLEDRVVKVDLKEKLPDISELEENIIFDFGGFDDSKIDEAISLSDLIIIPYTPTLESIQTTFDTIYRVKNSDKPILFVANMYQKDDDIAQSRDVILEALGFEAEIFPLPLSIGLQTAIAENKSIKELASLPGIRAYAYKKAAEHIQKLYDIININLR
jgi:chromosome partitioning protein